MDNGAARIENLRSEGRFSEAVHAICHSLNQRSHDHVLLDSAASTIVAAATADAAIQPDWCDPTLQSAVRVVAKQEACVDRTAMLAHAVAAHCIVPGSQRSCAQALEPAFAAMITDRDLNAHSTVALLTIREHCSRRIRQSAISAIHREWLPRFDWRHLGFPYNTIFTEHASRRNVDDLRRFVSDSAYVITTLRPCQILLLSWILQRDLVPLPIIASLADATDGSGCRSNYDPRFALCLRQWRDTSQQWSSAISGSLGLIQSDVLREHSRRQASLFTTRAVKPMSVGASLLETRWWQGVQFVVGRTSAYTRLRSRRRRPRVAICVSGQLRGFRQAWPTWQRNLLDGVDATIFVHTWTRVGNSDPKPTRASLPFGSRSFCDAWRRIGLREAHTALIDRYPRIVEALQNAGRVSAGEVMSLYGALRAVLDDESHAPFASWSNQEKMHYKIDACSRLLDADADRFDLVVRIRPDLPIRRRGFNWRHLSERCGASPVIFTERGYGQQYGHLMIGDQFAVGAPSAMRIYCSAWQTAPQLHSARALSTEVPFVGHSTLAEVCWLSGIDVRRVPLLFGPLLDMAPLERGVLRKALEADAGGRMDAIDRELIDAV